MENIPLLPFFYLIPYEIFAATKYINIPRNPMKAVLDNSWREIVESDDFKLVVMDITAALVWGKFAHIA